MVEVKLTHTALVDLIVFTQGKKGNLLTVALHTHTLVSLQGQILFTVASLFLMDIQRIVYFSFLMNVPSLVFLSSHQQIYEHNAAYRANYVQWCDIK